MITIVLCRPKNAGNVGAVARAMKNFGCEKLVLVAPRCDHLCKEATDRATHAKDILENARVVRSINELPDADCMVATTARLGEDGNLMRVPLSPRTFAAHLHPTSDCAILFGPEDHGLANEVIDRCALTVVIPTSPELPSLNLSHAVALVLYEITCAHEKTPRTRKLPSPSADELRALDRLVGELLDSMRFPTPHMRTTQKRMWKRVIARAFPTRQETRNMMGFFKNLLGRR